MDKNKLIQELRNQGISNQLVLNALLRVPRERFVLPKYVEKAYDNTALPLGSEQTISQPYIVALMTQSLLEDGPLKKVLEIGTGSGYQCAVLAELFEEVYTVERIKQLYHKAQHTLSELGTTNVAFKYGDGIKGWAEYAPFDGILVTAATVDAPTELLAQLHPNGGRLVIPLGTQEHQKLVIIKRHINDFSKRTIEDVRFVPLLPGTH